MADNLTATASTTINAPAADVWDALVTPEAIKQYMFGAQVVSDWREGSDIVWKGEWQGKAYEDKGVILKYEPDRVLQYSHFSPLSGAPDVEENYHTVTIKLDRAGAEQTRVVLTQDKNESDEALEHSRKNWETMLKGLKKYVEN